MIKIISNDINDLKAKLLTLNKGERIVCLYAISQVATDETGLDRQVIPVLFIDKEKNDSYSFVTSFFWHCGHDMIRDCCKKLNIKKFFVYTGFGTTFNYEQLLLIFDEIPNHFSDYLNNIISYVSFDKKDIDEKCEIERIPYEIKKLKFEIDNYKKFHESLEQKEARLEALLIKQTILQTKNQ